MWNTLKDLRCSKLGVAAKQKAACLGGGRWVWRVGPGGQEGDVVGTLSRNVHEGGFGFAVTVLQKLNPRSLSEAQGNCVQSVLALYGF